LLLEPDQSYEDEGYSGSLLSRPALERLRDTIASGQIERIDIEAGEGTILLPSDRIEIARTTWESPEIDRQTHTVHEAIETLVYDFLRQTHGGWEINDGAYGEFTFDVAERTIKLDYNERYTSSENFSHEF